MIHLPWGGSMGTADELSRFASQLKGIEKKLIVFYKNALNIEEQAILPLLKNETWLTGSQLTALGFTTAQQVQVAAKAYLKTDTMNKFTDKDRHWMESLFTKVLAKFKNSHMFNKVVQDATGIEIDFTDLPDDGVIETGLMATVDGLPAEGEFLMPDGSTYIFSEGELAEIIEAEAEPEAETAALRVENKNLKRQLNVIKGEVLALKRQVASSYSLDGKRAAYRRPAENDKLSGMKEYLRSKKAR